jgi:hypothetical protein
MFMVLNLGIYSFLLAVANVCGFCELDEAILAFGQFMFLSGLSSISRQLINFHNVIRATTTPDLKNARNPSYFPHLSTYSLHECEALQV